MDAHYFEFHTGIKSTNDKQQQRCKDLDKKEMHSEMRWNYILNTLRSVASPVNYELRTATVATSSYY